MSRARRTVCVTIDLDPAAAYHEIHGLPPPPEAIAHRFTQVALPRLRALLEALGVRATFFAVGQDLGDAAVVAGLAAARAAGHEVANHTFGHPYRFLDLPPADQASEIRRGHDAITAALGVTPVGFRAPGYVIEAPALAELLRLGYRYDASMLPSAPYYAAKAAAMAWMRLRGRPSRARLHPPTCLLAPARPYRPDPARPWQEGDAPIHCLPGASLALGFPLVGTFLGALPPAAAAWLGRRLARRPFVSVELHGLDAVDADDPAAAALAGRQPELGRSWERRRASLAGFLEALLPGADGLPLAEAID